MVLYNPNVDPVLDERRRMAKEREATAEADARASRQIELLAARKRYEDDYFTRNPSESRYAGEDVSLDAPPAATAPAPTPAAPAIPTRTQTPAQLPPASHAPAVPAALPVQADEAPVPFANMASYQAFLKSQMAPQEQSGSGSLSYDLGDGEGMRSYKGGMDMGAPEFAGDNVFGQARTTPVAGGGVSTPGGTDAAAYEHYRRNLYGDSQVDEEMAKSAESGARRARAAALTKDPFADQNRAFQLEAVRAQLRQQGDAAKEQAKLQPYFDLVDSEAAQHIKTYESTPDGTVIPGAGPMTQALRQKLIQDRLRLADQEKKDAASRLFRARTVNEPDPTAVS